MANKSKQKGNRFEYECVKVMKELGYENLCWHIEHWNTMGNSLCRYEINIIKHMEMKNE